MKESYGKGVTNHTDIESCAVGREANLEALTKACTGQPSSRERTLLQGADTVVGSGRPYRKSRKREGPPNPAREPGEPVFIRQMSGGSRQQVQGRNLTMHEHRQSYRVVVPAKSLNKTGQPTVAEGMEGRALVKGNEFQRNTNRAQYRRIVSRELERVWAMVIEGVHEILCLSPSSLR
jgi:hypothetical protein